jgi:FMN phosphatase YigB (HAD superfamily)
MKHMNARTNLKDVRWIGFDYGQCLMDSSRRKIEYWMAVVFIDLEKERPGIIDEKVKLYKELMDKYGSYPRLQEKGRDEIHSLILEDDSCLIRKYYDSELKFLKPAEGVVDALKYLKKLGKEISIVTDMGSGYALEVIKNFLNTYDLRGFFTDIISPAGAIRQDGSLDEYYKGSNKEDGSIFDRLSEELKNKGINPSQAAIIGDHPIKDVYQSKKRGFITIHYTPKKRETTEADYTITHFSQLKDIF